MSRPFDPSRDGDRKGIRAHRPLGLSYRRMRKAWHTVTIGCNQPRCFYQYQLVIFSPGRAPRMRFVALCIIGASLSRFGDVLCASAFKNFLRSLRPFRTIGVNRKQNSTLSYPSLVSFGLIFRNSQADQGARNAADCTTNAHTGQGGHDRSSGNQRPYTWNRQRTYASNPPENTPNHSSASRTRHCTLGSFRTFLVRKIL